MVKKSKVKSTLSSELEPAFPASPGRPPRYGFYVYKEGKNATPNCRGYYCFYGKYAAKHFLNLVIGDDEYEWVDEVGGVLKGSGETIKTSSGIIIDALGLEEIENYEFKNDAERNWSFPMGSDILNIRAHKLITKEKFEEIKSTKTEPAIKEEPKKVKKEKKPKIDKTGLITAKEIAEQMGVSPSDVRSSLRKGKIEKPEAGWAWPESEVEGIKAIVKKGLK